MFENLIIILCSRRVNKYITQSDLFASLISFFNSNNKNNFKTIYP